MHSVAEVSIRKFKSKLVPCLNNHQSWDLWEWTQHVSRKTLRKKPQKIWLRECKRGIEKFSSTEKQLSQRSPMSEGEQQRPYMKNNVWKGSDLCLQVKCNENSRLGEIQRQKLQVDGITWLELYHLDKRRLILKCFQNVYLFYCQLPYTHNPNKRLCILLFFFLRGLVLWQSEATGKLQLINTVL